MDIKIIIILVLVILSYAQYAYPTDTQKLLNPLWGAVQDKVGSFTGAKINTTISNTVSNSCPNTLNLVCGSNGITYNNTCQAAVAGIVQVTAGAC